MFSAKLPVLVTVAVIVLLVPTVDAPKLTSLGDSVTLVPTPLKFTIWGLLESESVIVSVPARVPVAFGVK
jgi:hypothetical protein